MSCTLFAFKGLGFMTLLEAKPFKSVKPLKRILKC